MKTQLALAFCVLVVSGCSENGSGRFLPTSPSSPNIAVDTKTGQSCRLRGKTKSAEEMDNLVRAIDVEKYDPDLAREIREAQVLPLCSEIIAAEEKSKERMTTFLGSLLLVVFGIYMTARHLKRKQSQ